MTIKAFGQLAESDPSASKPVGLAGVAIVATPATLEQLALFVAHAADEMRRLGSRYDHVHFMDFCNQWDSTWADIQIAKADEP